jgi:spermidine synthase
MRSLISLYEKYQHLTDKNTVHCYISSVYENLFNDIQDTCKNVLEIGIHQGGSIKLWKEYFINATIYAVDNNKNAVFPKDTSDEKIKLYVNDAYSLRFVDSVPNNNFDLIIDDGPHTLDSMIKFLQYYQSKLNENGILIIEDISDMNWIENFKPYILPENIEKYSVYDLRDVKGRYDDILFVIDKRNKL